MYDIPILYGPMYYLYDQFYNAWLPVYIYYMIPVFYLEPVNLTNVDDVEFDKPEVIVPTNQDPEFCLTSEIESKDHT